MTILTGRIHHVFEAPAPIEEVWDQLLKPQQWPIWAHHLRKVEVLPEGPLGPKSEAIVHNKWGFNLRVRMYEFSEGEFWAWRGRVLGVTFESRHMVYRVDDSRTKVEFIWSRGGGPDQLIGWALQRQYQPSLESAVGRWVQLMNSWTRNDSVSANRALRPLTRLDATA